MPNISRAAKENYEEYTLLCKKLLVTKSSAATLVLSWNVWSILNETKLRNFLCILEDMNIDVSCVTETWFDAKAGPFSKVIKDSGYEIHHAHREKTRGGGAAIIYKRDLEVKEEEASSSQYSSFEFASVTLTLHCSQKEEDFYWFASIASKK